MYNPDGSIPLDDLTYRQLQVLCKEYGVKATGRHNVLVERLEDYEIENDTRLKVYPESLYERLYGSSEDIPVINEGE